MPRSPADAALWAERDATSELARRLGACADAHGIADTDADAQAATRLHCTAEGAGSDEEALVARVADAAFSRIMAGAGAPTPAQFSAKPEERTEPRSYSISPEAFAGARAHLPKFDERKRRAELPWFGNDAGDDEDADPEEVAAFGQRGPDQLAAARTAYQDWKHARRLAAGTGRRAPTLARFLASHPATMQATGKNLSGFRG